MKRTLWLAGALAAVVATTGCPYTVRTSLPGHIKSIGIPIFVNETLTAAVEDELTQVVTERFQVDGHLQIEDTSAADAVLEGTLTAYDNKVFRFNDQEQAEEYVVTMVLSVTVRDRQKDKELWSQDGIRASATYLLGGPQARTELEARREVVEQLADILLSRTVEGW